MQANFFLLVEYMPINHINSMKEIIGMALQAIKNAKTPAKLGLVVYLIGNEGERSLIEF